MWFEQNAWGTHNTVAQHRVQQGRLHWQWPLLRKPWLMHFTIRLLTFAFKKDFKQYLLNNLAFVNKSESVVTWSTSERGMWWNLKQSSLEFSQWCDIFLARTRSAVIDKELAQGAASCSGWYAPQLCVCGVSLWNLPRVWLLNLQFRLSQFFVYFYFVFVQFVCHATQIPCQLVSLNIKTIYIEFLWLYTKYVLGLSFFFPFLLPLL